MSAARKVSTPLDPGVKLVAEGRPLGPELSKLYPLIVGKLTFLQICSRPDITYAANQLARFMRNPTVENWQSLMHVLRYLFHTKDVGIVYGTGTGLQTYH
jgi:hypothetical protein